jgi:SAM-dependent methyltransferase
MPLVDYPFNPVRAARKMRRMAQNLFWDLRYGGYCGGYKRSPYEDRGALGTLSTEYEQLDFLFGRGGVEVGASDVLVDVGCGKGRVLNYWLRRGWRNRMIGIELDAELADKARRRLRHYANVTVVTGDVLDHFPTDGTLFYLYYSFKAAVLKRFKDRVAEQCRANGRVAILYYNCVDLDVLRNDPAWEVTELSGLTKLFFPAALARLRPSAEAAPPGPRVPEVARDRKTAT